MFDVSQTHADRSLWEGLKTLDFSAFYQLLFSLEGFPGGSDSIESDCNTGEITMKNWVTNLALLRGGSPEPRALCGPVFICLVLEPCLLACLASSDTSRPGEPSTWPPRHQAPQGPDFSPPRSPNPRAWWPCYQVSGFRSHVTLSRKTFWLSLVSQEELASCAPQAADWPLSPKTHYEDASRLLDHKLWGQAGPESHSSWEQQSQHRIWRFVQ